MKRIVPPLKLYFSEKNNGIDVNGHRTRTEDLLKFWCNYYQVADDLSPITIVDLSPSDKKEELPMLLYPENFVVEITDTDSVSFGRFVSNRRVIINYQIGAKEVNGSSDVTLLGEEFFFTTKELDRIVYKENGNTFNLLVIPNGNSKRFFDLVDINHLLKLKGTVKIANNISRYELRQLMDTATVVVTTPSVTAMECLSVGLPTLLVKTSSDQTGKFVENGLGEWYSEDTLHMVSRYKSLRSEMSRNARAKVKNNIEKVCELILNEWRK